MNLITKYFKLESLPILVKDQIAEIAKQNDIGAESVTYIRKGLDTYKQPDFVPGEKAVVTYISTGSMDRDCDIIKPEGVDLTHFLKHPIVMFGHDYKRLPIGRAAWVKIDNTGHGLIAKTIYANTPEADLVYNYRKDGFPLAVSVGFLPTKYISKMDINKKEEFDNEVKNALNKGWVSEDKVKSINNIVQKWSLIEFSDTSVPSNPQALQIACSKGLISKEEYEEDMKTIIQIDGLKDEGKKETKVIVPEVINKEIEKSNDTTEAVIDNKTITPPSDLINKEIIEKVEQKKVDKKGNPSVDDIRSAIYVNMKKMREDMDKLHMEKGIEIKYEDSISNSSSYMNIEDLYPIDYPNGHVVCGYTPNYNSPVKYCDYKYKYDQESKTAEMGKMMEMEVSYTSKGNCVAEINKINKMKELNNKFCESTLKLEELKNVPSLPLIFHENLIDELGNYIGLVCDKNDNLYQTRLSSIYGKGSKYYKCKTTQADFPKFIATEAKSMEEWQKIKEALQEFYLKSAPGKEELLTFCKEHKLQHKDYLEKIESEDDIIEKGVDETENEIRIRVKDPSLFDQDSFRYKTIKSSYPKIKAVFGKLKSSSTMELQSYRFPKSDGWTKQSAKSWIKEHGKKSFEYVEGISEEETATLVLEAIEKRNTDLSKLIEEALNKAMGKVQM